MPKPVNVLKQPPPRYFTAVSFSRYRDHAECPRRARLAHLDKYAVPGTPPPKKSPAMERGERIHKLAEDYTLGKLAKLPTELKRFGAEFKALRKAKAVVEGKWGLTVKWEPCDFFDWNACWCRVVLDAHYAVARTARVIDHKTGKIYGDNADQLELYALGGFAYYPDVDEVQTELWYLDQGVILPDPPKVYLRREVPKLQKKWRERFIPMLVDRKFVPRPGPHCARCDFAKAKGGPCEFGG